MSNVRQLFPTNLVTAHTPPPWQGLGATVDNTQSLTEWQQAAGLDWEVAPVHARYTHNGNARVVEDKRILTRSDNGNALGIVSDSYKVVQPRQVLDFFRSLIDEEGFKMNAVGQMQEGRKIWALAEVPDNFTLPGSDVVTPYLLLSTSNDGSSATTAQFTTLRMLCMNMLHLLTNNASVKVRHNTVFDQDIVKRQLTYYNEEWDLFKYRAQEMAKRPVTQQEAVTFLLTVAGIELKEGQTIEEATKTSRVFKGMAETLMTGVGQDSISTGARGMTAWGLLQGATRFVDHEAGSRSIDNRLNSAWFGAGDKRKQLAYDSAVQLLGAVA